jgi:uracil-DNA glycosylase
LEISIYKRINLKFSFIIFPGKLLNLIINSAFKYILMEVRMEESWKEKLNSEFRQNYFLELAEFVKSEYRTHRIFPPGKQIFNAFQHCPFHQIKVVILGQDPYHGPGQANGLCFSVNDGIPFPPSLRNIFQELKSDLGKPVPASGNLERWSKQGVFLLNATLTVRSGMAASHQNKGWETFTDQVIATVSAELKQIVFILWGSYAQKKKVLIDQSKHLVIESPHPSPLSASRGFFGSRPFSKANDYLRSVGIEPIDW